jgi:hypothetical protein
MVEHYLCNYATPFMDVVSTARLVYQHEILVDWFYMGIEESKWSEDNITKEPLNLGNTMLSCKRELSSADDTPLKGMEPLERASQGLRPHS